MTTELSAERSRQALTIHTGRLAEYARTAGGDAAVPTCPGWTMADLVEHVGQTLNWVSEIIEKRIVDPADLPSTVSAELPADPQSWPAWLSAAADRAAAACSEDALEAPVFNPAGDDRPGARFWLRSMLNEAVVHGFDGAETAGARYDVDADVAADLITNHLAMLTSPGWAAQRPESATALRGDGETLLWRATDGDAYEWFVERRPDGARWQHGAGAAADVTVQGPAGVLFLVLTRRIPLTDERARDVAVDGHADLVRHWIENSAHIAD